MLWTKFHFRHFYLWHLSIDFSIYLVHKFSYFSIFIIRSPNHVLFFIASVCVSTFLSFVAKIHFPRDDYWVPKLWNCPHPFREDSSSTVQGCISINLLTHRWQNHLLSGFISVSFGNLVVKVSPAHKIFECWIIISQIINILCIFFPVRIHFSSQVPKLPFCVLS